MSFGEDSKATVIQEMRILTLWTVIGGKGESILSYEFGDTLRKKIHRKKETWQCVGGGKPDMVIFWGESKLTKG